MPADRCRPVMRCLPAVGSRAVRVRGDPAPGATVRHACPSHSEWGFSGSEPRRRTCPDRAGASGPASVCARIHEDEGARGGYLSAYAAACASVLAASERSDLVDFLSASTLAAAVSAFLGGRPDEVVDTWERALAAAFFSDFDRFLDTIVLPAADADPVFVLFFSAVPVFPGACDSALAAAFLLLLDTPFRVDRLAADAALGPVVPEVFVFAMTLSLLVRRCGCDRRVPGLQDKERHSRFSSRSERADPAEHGKVVLAVEGLSRDQRTRRMRIGP